MSVGHVLRGGGDEGRVFVQLRPDTRDGREGGHVHPEAAGVLWFIDGTMDDRLGGFNGFIKKRWTDVSRQQRVNFVKRAIHTHARTRTLFQNQLTAEP